MQIEPTHQKRSGRTSKKLRDEPERRFQFRLCQVLGYPHPDYLLEELSSPQYAEWLAFAQLEPIGDERADIRSAMAATAMVNAQGVRPKAKLEQFLPFRTAEKPQTPDELLRKAEALLSADDDSSRNQHEFHSNNREP